MKDTDYHNKKCPELQYKTPDLKHYHFPIIDSTNTWAKNNINQWSIHGITLVTATEQTGGRGRFKRHWESPPGVNIYATFCFFIDPKRADLGQIPQLLAYSTVQILEELKFPAVIKWPNDILIGGKKVAGVLCETSRFEQKLGMVCGIGLNVNMSMDFIEKIDQPATSLFLFSEKLHDIEMIQAKLVKRFSDQLRQFLEEGFAPFFADFESKSYYSSGQPICVHDGAQTWKGQFLKLNPDGSMTMLLLDNTVKNCISGEIVQEFN
jgi:BirA family biotin operon repressor/biotin-[acetyl-CoA-carboxylase] ligase